MPVAISPRLVLSVCYSSRIFVHRLRVVLNFLCVLIIDYFCAAYSRAARERRQSHDTSTSASAKPDSQPAINSPRFQCSVGQEMYFHMKAFLSTSNLPSHRTYRCRRPLQREYKSTSRHQTEEQPPLTTQWQTSLTSGLDAAGPHPHFRLTQNWTLSSSSYGT